MIGFIIFLLTTSNGFAKNVETIRYVALGDSYTIGTGADARDSWPTVLTQHLRSRGIAIELVANLGRNGWTTRDVIAYQLPVFKSLNPAFATLLIGVNDWVQGFDRTTFQKNLQILLDEILLKLPDKSRLLLITIPDFSVMPMGSQPIRRAQSKGRGLLRVDSERPILAPAMGGGAYVKSKSHFSDGRNISKGIDEYNVIITQEARARGLRVVDINPFSKTMGKNPKLVSPDGLHPSAQGYAQWEQLIFSQAEKILRK